MKQTNRQTNYLIVCKEEQTEKVKQTNKQLKTVQQREEREGETNKQTAGTDFGFSSRETKEYTDALIK